MAQKKKPQAKAKAAPLKKQEYSEQLKLEVSEKKKPQEQPKKSLTPPPPKAKKEVPAPAPEKKKKPAQEQNFASVSPRAEAPKKKKRKMGKKQDEDRLFLISTASSAPFAYKEAYKALRTNVNFISSTEDVRSVVVTSAIPRESKSNVAINLAINMATEGKKVILVDCDLRKPVLHKYLKLGRNRQGLTDVLANKASINDCIVKFKDVKIHALPAGTIPPNPTEILSQERMHKLVEILKETYDFVIIDAPPVSVVTDAAILGKYVDGALLVVRSKFAPIESVQLAKKKLEDLDIKIFGVIISRYNVKKTVKNSAYSYTYGYGYGYGYGDNNG